MTLFAEVNLSTEAALGIVTAVVLALAAAVGQIFRMLMQTKNDQLEYERSQKKSYKEIAEEAVRMAESKVPPEKRAAPLAPVVGEHNSPQTQKQKEDAELMTLRARVTAATLASGLPPREIGGQAEPEITAPETPIPTIDTQQLREDIAEVKKIAVELPDKVVEKIAEQSPPEKAP